MARWGDVLACRSSLRGGKFRLAPCPGRINLRWGVFCVCRWVVFWFCSPQWVLDERFDYCIGQVLMVLFWRCGSVEISCPSSGSCFGGAFFAGFSVGLFGVGFLVIVLVALVWIVGFQGDVLVCWVVFMGAI